MSLYYYCSTIIQAGRVAVPACQEIIFQNVENFDLWFIGQIFIQCSMLLYKVSHVHSPITHTCAPIPQDHWEKEIKNN